MADNPTTALFDEKVQVLALATVEDSITVPPFLDRLVGDTAKGVAVGLGGFGTVASAGATRRAPPSITPTLTSTAIRRRFTANPFRWFCSRNESLSP